MTNLEKMHATMLYDPADGTTSAAVLLRVIPALSLQTLLCRDIFLLLQKLYLK